ncbi:MAG: hypothetical protein SXG53_27880, partial [Pseudomonadota bacterium]|nr:hypothetical protein [Pseudomonadota bacterium]
MKYLFDNRAERPSGSYSSLVQLKSYLNKGIYMAPQRKGASRTVLSTALAAAIASITSGVYAQDPALDEIVVTGSRIRVTGMETP